ALPDFAFFEEFEEFGIDFTVFDGETENVQRALQRNGLLIRAVGGGECVEDVRDRHHAGLDRDLLRGELERIAKAVESLVVAARNHGNALDLFGPRDLLQELKSM